MKFIAKTLYGFENVLAGEIKSLGGSDVVTLNRAVSFSGDKKILYSANYNLRTALSVLMVISEFRIRSGDDLYRIGKKTDWSRFLTNENTFSIVPVIKSQLFKHTGYAGLVLKDSIADWFRDKTGSRPSVDTVNPDIVFNLHISNDLVTISADSSVVPLYKRGYRREQGTAPLNEVLAAGIVLISEWNGNSTLVDPMCGSGTIPVEAALIAGNIPPGRFRNSYGFQKWSDFDEDLFEAVRKESELKAVKPAIKIFASDVSEEAVNNSIENIKSSGLTEIISVRQQNFDELESPDSTGVIIMNPPYGERLKITETDRLYDMIGSSLKHNFEGFRAWIISSDKEALKKIGLKPSQKITLYNGALECTLVKFDIYPGTRKRRSQEIQSYEP